MTSTVKKYKYKICQLVSYWEYFEVEADDDDEAVDIVQHSGDSDPVYTEYRDSEEPIIEERELNCPLTKMLREYNSTAADNT